MVEAILVVAFLAGSGAVVIGMCVATFGALAVCCKGVLMYGKSCGRGYFECCKVCTSPLLCLLVLLTPGFKLFAVGEEDLPLADSVMGFMASDKGDVVT